jgi:hypothetical protein
MRRQPRISDQNVGNTRSHWFASGHRWQDDTPPGFGRLFFYITQKVGAVIVETRRLHSERCASPSAVTQALAFRGARPIAWKLMKRVLLVILLLVASAFPSTTSAHHYTQNLER